MRPMLAFGYGYYLKVSIHASVKDATKQSNIKNLIIIVSIHASVKDATMFDYVAPPDSVVSIHASVKDATPCL